MKISRILGWMLVGVFVLEGCSSVQTVAIQSLSDVLSQENNSSVFTGDNDPQLVGDALPFTLKMYESLAASSPNHRGLARTVGMLYIMYTNAYVAGPADYLGIEQYEAQQAARKRALNLYHRGRDFVLKAIDLGYPGFAQAWRIQDVEALNAFRARFQKDDVAALYWFAAGQMAILSLDPLNVEFSVPVPQALALLTRAYELDPGYQKAALDELLISVYASLPTALGGNPERARIHFERAIEKTQGRSTTAYLGVAVALDLPQQNKVHFLAMLDKVLAVDPQADPSTTLVTLLNQERARWYRDQADDLFVE